MTREGSSGDQIYVSQHKRKKEEIFPGSRGEG